MVILKTDFLLIKILSYYKNNTKNAILEVTKNIELVKLQYEKTILGLTKDIKLQIKESELVLCRKKIGKYLKKINVFAVSI